MNILNRSLLRFCGLLILVAPATASAQDFAANVAKAQSTLDSIASLIDGIQARHASAPGTEAAGSTDPDSLFDGKSLAGWKRTEFRGAGQVTVERSFRGGPGTIVVSPGSALTGITYTKAVPKTNYEITLECMKIEGLDFMCGLTFPVGDSHASLILGGWGGNVVGISSLDGHDASENETSRGITFVTDHWYKVRMRVTPKKLEAWLDDKKIVDQDITNRKVSLRFGEISKSVPLGLATYQTKAAYRAIKLHKLEADVQ
jgi:hypothetical protein